MDYKEMNVEADEIQARSMEVQLFDDCDHKSGGNKNILSMHYKFFKVASKLQLG